MSLERSTSPNPTSHGDVQVMENEMEMRMAESSKVASKADSTRARTFGAALVALTVAATSLAPRTAHAEEVPPTGKGIAGGALLGAEIITIPMGIAGVQSGAAYLVGGGIGLVGGGVGGYLVEQNVSDGRVPVYMLAGGLALVIPALVLSLNATTYRPVEGVREDRAPGPPADPGSAGGSIVIGAPPAGAAPAPAPAPATPAPATTPAPAGPPQSMLDLGGPSPRFGVPVPQVRPLYSLAEQKRLGVSSGGTEVRMPLVHVRF